MPSRPPAFDGPAAFGEATRPRWPTWAGVLVGLGCLVTIAYTVVENFWG